MSTWKKPSVKSTLIGAFGLLILLILALSAAALASIQQVGDQFSDYVHGVQARAAAAHQVRQAVDRRASAARNLMLVTRPDDIAAEKAAVATAMTDVRQALDTLQALSAQAGVPAEARRRVDDIAAVEVQYRRVAEAVLGLVFVGDREAAIARMNERCRPLLAALVKATDDYIRHTAEISARLVADHEVAHTRRMLTLALGCALIVGLSCAVAFAVTRSVVVPLNRAVALVGGMARGHLTTEVQVDASDEIGRLLQAIRDMQGADSQSLANGRAVGVLRMAH